MTEKLIEFLHNDIWVTIAALKLYRQEQINLLNKENIFTDFGIQQLREFEDILNTVDALEYKLNEVRSDA